jgi:type IV pilus assembly protein PilV
MSPNIKSKEEKGFTLIEVLIAVSILTVGILAVASMQISAIRGNYIASTQTGGTTWAQDKIEYLMSLDYADPDLDAGSHTPETHDIYTISWNVAADDPINNTKTISVNVTWVDRGAAKSISLDYIKAILI